MQNFPTVGLIDGNFRQNLEETGMSYEKEVQMVALARRIRGCRTLTLTLTPTPAATPTPIPTLTLTLTPTLTLTLPLTPTPTLTSAHFAPLGRRAVCTGTTEAGSHPRRLATASRETREVGSGM